MRTGIDPKLKNTLVASLAPADSSDLMQPVLTKSKSSAKNERGRASIRGLSNQIGGSIKNSAQHKMSSGSSCGAGVIADANVSVKLGKASSEVSEGQAAKHSFNSNSSGDKMLADNKDYDTKNFNFNNSDIEGMTASQLEPIEMNASAPNNTSSPLTKPMMPQKQVSGGASSGLKKQSSKISDFLITSSLAGSTQNSGLSKKPQVSHGPSINSTLPQNAKELRQISYQQYSARQRRSIAVQRKLEPETSSKMAENYRNRLFSSEVTLYQEQKIDQAQKNNKLAVEFYKHGDYFDALTHLQKAVKMFKVEKLDEQLYHENEVVYKIIKDCYLFSASCYIKINQFESAIQQMDLLLDVEPLNFKALYLRGRAYFFLNEMTAAYDDLMQAHDIEPQNPLINRYIDELLAQCPEIENQVHQAGQMIESHLQNTATQFSNHGKIMSMNSTNANSGSENGGYQSIENQKVVTVSGNTVETQLKIQQQRSTLGSSSAAGPNIIRLQKQNSIMHPSSPSKIKIDETPKANQTLGRVNRTKSTNNPNNISSSDESVKINKKQSEFSSLSYILRHLWQTHKGTFFQVIQTLLVLFVIIMIKKGLSKLIPVALQDKLKSLIL